MNPSQAVTDNEPVRASVRFPLHLAVTLNADGREYRAVTRDVSANGVLFIGEELPPVDTVIRFRINMPADVMGGTGDVVVSCVGRIVRHRAENGLTVAAAVIDEYSLKAEQV
ncbi:MAG: PilZ domain-containing protein [Acidobacteriaceae bacterium]|nr:PilZ domain-containing protein [Acidobacteriaceae bacterium]